MKQKNYKPITFMDAYRKERRDFGQVKPYTQTFKSKKDYDRKQMRIADRKRFAEEA